MRGVALKLGAVVICVLWGSTASVRSQPVSITVDPSVKLQEMTGWEATAWANQESPAFPRFKDTLYDLAVNDLGINRLRLEVRSGCENDPIRVLLHLFVGGADLPPPGSACGDDPTADILPCTSQPPCDG